MRSIWTGSVSFGLINIPVKLYSASKERKLSFRMLDKHGNCPISYMRVCRNTGKEVSYDDIVKGYEYQKGDYVILSDEDFQKAAPKKTKTIDIINFVSEDEIPSEQITKPYFLEPDKKAEKAYVLLREALKRSKKVGIGEWVLRNKSHIAMIRPEGKALMLIQLRYADEMRDDKDLELPGKSDFSDRELDMALSLVKQLTEHFEASQYEDEYTKELEKAIERKKKGKPIRVEEEGEPVPTDMRDLMKALEKSLRAERQKTAA